MKPRPKSKLASLSEIQRHQLVNWLLDENLTYEVAIEKVQREFGIKVGQATICEFYQREVQARFKLPDKKIEILIPHDRTQPVTITVNGKPIKG